nr:MAG TPA: hypothetical protein [Caudoviricetes sp.]
MSVRPFGLAIMRLIIIRKGIITLILNFRIYHILWKSQELSTKYCVKLLFYHGL